MLHHLIFQLTIEHHSKNSIEISKIFNSTNWREFFDYSVLAKMEIFYFSELTKDLSKQDPFD